MGTRFGLWNHALLLCIPLFLFLFAIYYSVSALAGVLWKNATVSIVLTILFWAACFTVETANGIVEQFFVNPTRLVSLVPTDEAMLAVNQSGEFVQWHSDAWQTIHKPKQSGPPFRMDQVLLGPLYDAQRKELLYIQRPAGGRFDFLGPGLTLNTARWNAGAWKWDTGPAPPSGASWLFHTPQGETLLVAASGVYRLDEKAESQRPAPKVLGFTLPLGGGGPYVAVGPQPPLHWKESCAAALHPASGDLVVYDAGTLTYLRRDPQGHYARGPQRSWPTTDRGVALAFAGQRIVVAQADGRILLLDAETLKTEKEWSPVGQSEPFQAMATAEGGWFAVLFHTGTLVLFDAEGQRRTSFGSISAASFQGNDALLVADRAVRVTQYGLDPLHREQTYAPRLDALQATYRYFLLPFSTVFPKPGKLGNVVNYLLTKQETVSAGSPTSGADLRQTRVRLDVAGPFWSSLAFIVVVLGLTCLYLHRADI